MKKFLTQIIDIILGTKYALSKKLGSIEEEVEDVETDEEEIELDEELLLEYNPDKPEVLAFIRLDLLSTGDVNVLCDWAENNEELGAVYGDMLFHLNDGAFQHLISQILIEHASNNIKSQIFVQSALRKWKDEFCKKGGDTNAPMVNPSLALKMSRGFTGEEEE